MAQHEPKRSIHVILHGEAATPDELEPALVALRADGHQVTLEVTEAPRDAIRMARDAADPGRCIVAAGGDGTLNEVVQGLFQTGDPGAAALGILPLGTANDFATAAGIPCNEPRAALQLITETDPVPIDVGRMNGRPFLNVATGGFGSQVTAETPQELKQMLGGLSYLLTGLRFFNEFSAEHGRAAGPDFEWEGHFVALAVGNGRRAGGGITLCPRARSDDGLLDVMILPEDPEAKRLERLLTLLKEGWDDTLEREAVYRQVPELELSVPTGLQVNLDGEPLTERELRFEVQPGALRVHLPESSLLRTGSSDEA